MNIIKQDRINMVRELLVTQMNHWALFPLYVMLVEIIGNIAGVVKPHILLWLIYGCIPFFLFFARSTFRKFWTLGIAHAAVIGIMFLIPAEHLVVRIIHIAVGIGYVIHSAYLWTSTTHRKDGKLPPLFSVALSVIMLLILNKQQHTGWDKTFVTVLIIVLGLYFITYYIERYQNFLTVNNSSAGHIPAKEIFKSGMGLVIGYTGVGLLILFLISNIGWLKVILQFFKDIIFYIVRGISALFPRGAGEITQEPENPQLQMMENMMPDQDLGEGHWLWQILDAIIEFVFLAGLIALLVAAVVFLARFIIKKLKAYQPDTDAADQGSVIDVREKCEVEKNNKLRVTIPFLQTDPKERIRLLYKKRLLASKTSFTRIGNDASLLNRYTARESGMLLERNELGLIYEKARYSNAECDNEDVKQMRNACK